MIRATLDFLRALPCKPLLLLTLGCLVLREQFPFSNFPMYSSFTNKTSYVYLADGAGKPVAAYASTGRPTSQLKKIYQREVLKEARRPGRLRQELTAEEKGAAGARVLTTLRDSEWARRVDSAFPAVVRLYEVKILLRKGRFDKQSLLIAEVR
jgi:hypothetical protein